MFGDDFNKLPNDRRFLKDPSDNTLISEEQYKTLKEKAEKFDLLVEQYEKLKSENEILHREIEGLRKYEIKIRELKEQSEEYLNSMIRVKADFENFKKISEREKERYKFYVKESILKKLIEHYDDLIRTLVLSKSYETDESLMKGFEMVVKNFEKLLVDEGVEPMNCEGEKFDPYKHDAVMVEHNEDIPEDIITKELNKGYYFNNKKQVLRPARVKISKKSNNEIL